MSDKGFIDKAKDTIGDFTEKASDTMGKMTKFQKVNSKQVILNVMSLRIRIFKKDFSVILVFIG